MGTTTDNLDLYKPALAEYFRLIDHFNDNWDIIDAATIGFSFAIPIDTPGTVGNDKGTFHFAPGIAGTISEVYLIAKVAPGAGKTLTVDVNKGGTTIFTTQGNRPSLVDTAKTDTSGAPDVTTFVKNDLFTIDVDVSTAESAIEAVIVLIRGLQNLAAGV